jgi:3',5'-cyclic AMP phosphodiesterase CpdA
MRTLVHLSDLHFGRVDETLLDPLRELIHRLAPDVVVVSGDLTQRAKSEQFEAARAWLDTLPGPQIIVPGNHDISLYNVFRRFVQPLTRYKRYITEDGRINQEQVAMIRSQLAGLGSEITRIIVTHHPFDLPETADDDDLVDRAPMAMRAFADCGVDILLSGHMHTSHAKSTAERYQFGEYAALVIQAGTATSTRGRGETNSFNVVRVDSEQVEVQRYGWDVISSSFSPMNTEKFFRSGNVWAAHTDGLFAAGI